MGSTESPSALVDIYSDKLAWQLVVTWLWDLLAERPAVARISHKTMPTYEEHEAFVASRPYAYWYLIHDGAQVVGAVYLTYENEIGVHIFEEYQRRGHARRAIAEIMKRHPREQFYANIAPHNETSKQLFVSAGFRELQHTYVREGK